MMAYKAEAYANIRDASEAEAQTDGYQWKMLLYLGAGIIRALIAIAVAIEESNPRRRLAGSSDRPGQPRRR